MARPIKFRAWDKKNKQYVKVLKLYFGSNGHILGALVEDYETNYAFELQANQVELEQDTGLEDKNDTPIYEGDIVNVIGIGIAQVIDSPSGEWMLYYRREPDEINSSFVSVVPKNKPSGLWKTNTTSYIEIIGTIHENPELLEGENGGN